MALEVSGEVGLVVGAGDGGDLGRGDSGEQMTTRPFDPSTHHVRMGADAELCGETADQVGLRPTEQRGCRIETEFSREVLVEQQSESLC